MAKYDPLRDALIRSGASRVIMTFAEVEALIGSLPSTAAKRDEWWANEDPSNTRHVQCRAWGEAGYKASVDRRSRTIVFIRGR